MFDIPCLTRKTYLTKATAIAGQPRNKKIWEKDVFNRGIINKWMNEWMDEWMNE